MEDSNLYSNQDIKRLKQNIDSYRETLTSLKRGTPLEDYLCIKEEFDGIKTQITDLEEKKGVLNEKQNSQIQGNEEQLKLLSMQIESLNQTIEEMNQDIATILKSLLTLRGNIVPATTYNANITQRPPKTTPTNSQSGITAKQPSYKMLQSLAGKATNTQSQLDDKNGTPSTHNEDPRNRFEERHFNQQYFQSINTQPSQIYNGLYRNTTTESTFHFKNATNAQEIPISVYQSNTLPHAEIHKSTDNELNANDLVNYVETARINNNSKNVALETMSSVVVDKPDIPEESKVTTEQININKSSSLKNAEIEVFETKIEEDETLIQIENKPHEDKKERNSLLFNFFRKWS